MESSHLNTVPKYSSMYASPGSCSVSKGSLVLQAKSSLFIYCRTLQSCIPSPLLTPSLQSVLSFWPAVGTSKELLKNNNNAFSNPPHYEQYISVNQHLVPAPFASPKPCQRCTMDIEWTWMDLDLRSCEEKRASGSEKLHLSKFINFRGWSRLNCQKHEDCPLVAT